MKLSNFRSPSSRKLSGRKPLSDWNFFNLHWSSSRELLQTIIRSWNHFGKKLFQLSRENQFLRVTFQIFTRNFHKISPTKKSVWSNFSISTRELHAKLLTGKISQTENFSQISVHELHAKLIQLKVFNFHFLANFHGNHRAFTNFPDKKLLRQTSGSRTKVLIRINSFGWNFNLEFIHKLPRQKINSLAKLPLATSARAFQLPLATFTNFLRRVKWFANKLSMFVHLW